MNAAIDRCALWLADIYLLSAVLMLAVLAALWISQQPARRLAVVKSAIVALFLLSLLRTVPGWSVVHLGVREQLAANDATADLIPPNLLLAPRQDAARPSPLPRQEAAPAPVDAQPPRFDQWPAITWSEVAVLTYALGAALVVAWLCLGMVAARRLCRATQPAPDELVHLLAQLSSTPSQSGAGSQFLPNLRTSLRIHVPVAIGIRRPTIILPAQWLSNRSADECRTILAHESAHIQNGDLRWLAISRALLILLWPQPLYWLLRRQMRLDQESLADAAAAELTSRQQYAEQLVAWARALRRDLHPTLTAAVGLWEGPSQLRRRIALLLNDRLTLLRQCPREWRVGASMALVAAAIGLSFFTIQPASKAADEPNAPNEGLRDGGEQQANSDYIGEVIDEQTGAPISDAKVSLRIYDATHVQPWKTVAETTAETDTAGRFEFSIPHEARNSPLVYCRFELAHPDYSPTTAQPTTQQIALQNATRADGVSFQPIAMRRGELVTGALKRPDGSPAANIPVEFYSEPASKGPEINSEFGKSETDENGKFHVAIAPGESAVIWFLPQQFSAQTQFIDLKRGDLGTFQLEDGVRLSGQVLDQHGSPLPDVWVNARLLEGPAKKPIQKLAAADQIDRSALTDQDGRFQLGPLPSGTYRIVPDELPEESDQILQTPHPLHNAFLPTRVNLSYDAANPPIEIRAVESVAVAVQFLDSKGEPTRGYGFFLIGTTPEGQHYASRRFPDQAGKIKFLVPKGLTTAYVDLPISSVRQRIVPDKPLSKNQKLYLGRLDHDWRDITIVRYQAPVLLIDPVDADGKRVANVKVTAEYASVDQTGTRYAAPTEQLYFDRQTDGRWRCDSAVPDEEFRVTLSADRYQRVSKTMSLKEGETNELSITLPKGEKSAGDQSSGRKTEAGGAIETPAKDGKLEAQPEQQQGAQQNHSEQSNDVSVKEVPHANGNSEVTQGSQSTNATVTPTAPAKIVGQVTNKDGKVLAGVLVRAAVPATDMRFAYSDSDHETIETKTGENGRYELQLPKKAGAITVSIDAMTPGYRRLSDTFHTAGGTKQLTVSPGNVVDASFSLEPALYVKGLVVDENGNPVPSVQIGANGVFLSADGKFARAVYGIEGTVSSKDGSFEIFNFPLQPDVEDQETEKGGLHFFHPDYAGKHIDDIYALSPDQRTTLSIVLPTGRRVSGIVLDMNGHPVANVMVEASDEKDHDRKTTITDADGKFFLRGLVAGSVIVRAHDLKQHQKIAMPITLDRDFDDLKLNLQPISLTTQPKTVSVLGMTLTDLTPDLSSIYDLYDQQGALILDPGKDSARLNIGELHEGYCFTMAGDYEHIGTVREFIKKVLDAATSENSPDYFCRVVYSVRTVDGIGSDTQYLKLTEADLRELRDVLSRLPGD
jgi:beta-lactamase regulating signal transducer with metallopeptidase domain/protocatechuate 3,4-dioxygenase beta subunit